MSPSRARCCAEEPGRGVRAIAGEGGGQDRPVSDLTRVPEFLPGRIALPEVVEDGLVQA